MTTFKHRSKLQRAVITMAAMLLCACASMQDDLKVPEGTALASYQRVIQSPKEYVGEVVRWGGVIASVINKSDYSMIEVTYYPISTTGRPNVDERYSSGRFRAKLNGFADPIVYAKGKALTVVGQLEQPQQDTIGEFNYIFPIVNIEKYYLWQDLPDYDPRYYDPWYGRGYGYYGPYYRHPYRYYRH
ncbi:Slp family lipoprotein [Echinimonas agarilytica]|uniref:Slp family lipoprotein n=1 Tax=Echinimonas agarilytica TaxID=1215918 RepID=A0AA41W627_9GAMM|nr:Slp family lipoprotein [Echinimonas agarilytica]MCM2679430.1 Slp family lipoprotein [Echinimonas agarilytica]